MRPEPVPLPDPQGEYLSRVWKQSVYPLAERLKVVMRMPQVKPRSRLAHEAASWARKRGDFDLMNEAIFRAYFERSEDIGQPSTLVSLAASVGLDADSLKESLDNHEHLEEVIADEQLAARYGLTGVPAFVAAGTVLFGVQSVETLEEFVRLASRASESPRDHGPLPHLPVRIGK